MTKQTERKKATRRQHAPEYRAEALALAEKVGVSQAANELGLHGHNNGQITTHYSAAEIGELIDAVEKVSWSGSSAPTLTLIKNENSCKSPAIGRRENLKSV